MLPGQLCGFVLIVVVVVEAVVVGVIVAAVGAVVVAFVVVDVGFAVAVVEEPPSMVLAWRHQAPACSPHCCSASSSPRKVRPQVGGLFHFPLLLTSSLRCSQRSLVRLDCSSGD